MLDENLPPLLTPTEVARLLRVTTRTVAKMCASGKLPATLVGAGSERRRWRIPRAAVLALLESDGASEGAASV